MKPESLSYLESIRRLSADINVQCLVDSIIEIEGGCESTQPISLNSLNFVTTFYGLQFIRFVRCCRSNNLGFVAGNDYVIPVLGGFCPVCRFDGDTDDNITGKPYVLLWRGNDDHSCYRRFGDRQDAETFMKTHPVFDANNNLYMWKN